jgi:signal transduction histidine kinase
MLSSHAELDTAARAEHAAGPEALRSTLVDVDVEIVRRSLRLRCQQAFRIRWPLSFVLFSVGALLWPEEGIPKTGLVAWLGLTFLALCWRVVLCRKVIERLDQATPAQLHAFQRRLLWHTMPLNLAMGAGVWWVAAPVASTEIQFFVTLAVCFYAVGALISLSSHPPSFELALVCNLGQAILFWLLQGTAGMKISIPLVVTAYLLVTLGRENQRAFAESVRMQFENLELVAQLDREKAAVEKALAVAQDASRSKSAFLAAASHDLRQPLHAISFYMATLSMHVQEGKPRQLVQKVRDTLAVLEKLFGNLLDLARFDTGNVQPQIQVFDVDAVLQHLDRAYRPLADAKGLGWIVRGVHAPVSTDAVLLERLLGNLVHNAVKYTDSGCVQISAELEPMHVRVTVEDTGCGIPAHEQERIFDEFYQLQNPGRRREGGVGLGLSIVRRIDRLLRLDVQVESDAGRGTRFVLRIPRGPASHEVFETLDNAETLLRGQAVKSLPLHVWVLEDDATVRDALATQLEDWGCQAHCVSDEAALNALRAAEGRWPDVLIADDMLGEGRSGLEVACTCASELDRRRIIVMTGSTLPERLEAIRTSGFQLMCKPASPAQLYERLSQIADAGG